MEIAKLTFAEIKKLTADRKLHDPVRVRLSSNDFADSYYIVEDCRFSAGDKHNKSYFLFYPEDAAGDDLAFECYQYDTLIEAVLYHAYRFVLDNCDGADSLSESISARHDSYQTALRKLVGE